MKTRKEKARVDSRVVSKVNFPFFNKNGIDIRSGTSGTVLEVQKGGPEGVRYHVEFEVGGRRKTSTWNVFPSQIEVVSF